LKDIQDISFVVGFKWQKC